MREYPIPPKDSAEIKTIFWLYRLMIMVDRAGTAGGDPGVHPALTGAT